MLPELLFSVGSSIQEMSREEYSFLNGGTIVDRDTASASNDSTLSQLKLVRTPDLEPSVTIKLEEPTDTYPWLNTDIESNLLRHSDDPLLSRASDDHQQNELATIKTTISSSPFPTDHQTSTGSAPEKRKSTRSRRKGQFKLRFHHQALPQEYLEHFEASKNNQRQDDGHKLTTSSVMDTPESPQDRTNESIRNWLQKISELQNEAVPPTPEAEMEVERKPSTSSGSKAIKYSDLPYMGEITLENSKPRRGRKPKKADICHLIYKNYGTIFPGTPKDVMDGEAIQEEAKKSDLQAKIVNSLLEKRLTQKEVRQKLEEPLNLCVRDMDSVILSDDESSMAESSRTSPLISVPDLSGDALLESNLKMTLPNFKAALMDKSLMPETPSTGDSASGGYVYWPNANVFIHPMSLYYQKMIDNAGEKRESDKQKNANNSCTSQSPAKGSDKKQSTTPSTRPSPASSSSGSSSKVTTPGPHKRKRSAIFIPPIPAENASNPATEVSICKFKFTGGAKPSLQEKKMLSVDSGGNFRYYSGTGDKSMRGYEFFPRESLQQSGLVTGSSAGAFLNTPPSEKIAVDCMTPDVHQRSQSIPGKSSSSPTPAQRSDHRKRKSRRSLQREKLEKTFKERGFLIQTQQTESAEGATYCKFRQLKKFTRYLFRSWKDYLPGDLQQQQQQQGGETFAIPSTESTRSTPIGPLSVPFTEVGK